MNAPNTLLMCINLLDNTCFVNSLQLALWNDHEMLSGRYYSYTGKNPEETFRIDLQEAFKGFCEGFVLYEMHNGLDMSL